MAAAVVEPAAVLARVRNNFQYIASRGWFQPASEGHTGVFQPGKKGGPRGYRKAAVLALVSYRDEKLQVLITKRSDNISFKGETCLPGGSEDSKDSSPADTALREAEEEVGLDRNQVEVVCTLPPQSGPSRGRGLIIVRTVVALLKCSPDELKLSPNPYEVDCYFWVPLQHFLNEPSRIIKPWNALSYDYVDPEGDSHCVWGFTAFLCVVVAAVSLNQLPNFSYKPMLVSRVERQGEKMLVTHSRIALTQAQAATIPVSKL